MGFSPFPPRPDLDLLLQALELWSTRADAAILHMSVPWAGLLQGQAPEALLEANGVGLAEYFRGKNLPLTVTIDVTDGLNRAAEAPELVAAGRSITEPAVQQLYAGYARELVRVLQPEFVGLAAETNLIRAAAPAPVYAAVVTMANAAAQQIRGLGSGAKLYVSVQVEVAWGRLGGVPAAFEGVERDFADFPFVEALGLSSYPYLAGFAEPEELPLDYYERVADGRPIPLLVVEGGWPSESAAGFVSSPAEQSRYLRRHAEIAAKAPVIRWFQLSFTDLDLTAFPEVSPILPLFARLGLVDADLRPKPALEVWDSLVARRRGA